MGELILGDSCQNILSCKQAKSFVGDLRCLFCPFFCEVASTVGVRLRESSKSFVWRLCGHCAEIHRFSPPGVSRGSGAKRCLVNAALETVSFVTDCHSFSVMLLALFVLQRDLFGGEVWADNGRKFETIDVCHWIEVRSKGTVEQISRADLDSV